ncbi:CPBP family intramembrane glutamic endopeptidase [Falsibacillus albus]|uniref:CPBP family intramembrane metalloprotease n=1 Tax=Falsibacillus albus TaxID=2478915 RepID=A0A3L7K2X8_9BACI|nr:type II CAAX endopeptidase family protein [Falsibacillus albus]RLQ95062.1 CPBP family intramembrane metalloprotease [Falsibacillus albus]
MKKQSEIIKSLTAQELAFHVYSTQFVLLTISILLGIFLFDSVREVFELFRWNTRFVLLGITMGSVVVLLDIGLMKLLPEKYYDDGGINEKIFKNRTILEILFFAITIAICEELLFRGIIQTHTNWIVGSIIFALIHIRYWGHWYLIVNILLLSLLISGLYEWTDQSLLAVMFMHFIIDFLLGIVVRENAKKALKEGMNHEN